MKFLLSLLFVFASAVLVSAQNDTSFEKGSQSNVVVLSVDNAGTVLHLIKGITEAADQGADIINIEVNTPKSQAIQRAIRYASEKGCTIVSAN